MKKIGLTGSIGSGKTIVSHIFSSMGVPVYYADIEAKKFLVYKEIRNLLFDKFGKNILGIDNEIDRKKLASLVFNNQTALTYLNSLIHPLVKSDFKIWSEQFIDEAYIIHEAAILYESGFYKSFNAIISVTAPEEIRITRVMKRDKVDKDDVLKRIDKQWSDERKVGKADYIIYNDEQNLVIPQVLSIHTQLSVIS